MAKLSKLDGIRAIAVLLVVVSHLLLQLGAKSDVYDFRVMGHLGVAIFFVHTTLVLLGSLERHGPAALPFYVRRAFRIYPLAIAIVGFVALIQLAGSSPIDHGRLLSNIFLVQNITGDQPYIGPLWSLPYEVQMYVLLPLLFTVVTRMRGPVLWCSLLYVVSVVLAALDGANLASFHVPGTHPSLLRFAPCFIAGALAFALSNRSPRAFSPVLLAALMGGGIATLPWLVAAGLPETPLMWMFCLTLACAIPACRELSCRPVANAARTVATYSYGVYLTHVFALGAIDGLMPGPVIVQWAAMLILLPGLAYISYHGIEKHGVALGARLAERWARRSQPAQACDRVIREQSPRRTAE